MKGKFQATKQPDKRIHTIFLRASDELRSRLLKEAKAAKLTTSELVRQMVEHCLEEIENKDK